MSETQAQKEIRKFLEKIQRFNPEFSETEGIRFVIPVAEIVSIDYQYGVLHIRLKDKSEFRIYMLGVEYLYPVDMGKWIGYESVELKVGKLSMKLGTEYIEVKIP